jgi:hypothetical protein
MSKDIDTAATQYLRGMHDGAVRATRRIRRALAGFVSEAKRDHYWSKCGCATCELIRAINDATRSRGKGRK